MTEEKNAADDLFDALETEGLAETFKDMTTLSEDPEYQKFADQVESAENVNEVTAYSPKCCVEGCEEHSSDTQYFVELKAMANLCPEHHRQFKEGILKRGDFNPDTKKWRVNKGEDNAEKRTETEGGKP